MYKKIYKKAYKMKYIDRISVQKIYKYIQLNYSEVNISRNKLYSLLKCSKSSSKEVYSETERNLMLGLYKRCYSVNKLIIYLNERHHIEISKQALAKMAYIYGVNKKRIDRTAIKFLDIKKEKEVVKRYKNGESALSLYKEYGFKTKNSIYQILEKYNTSRRTLEEYKEVSYREFDLQNLDTEFKAYFLGLLMTDGYIIKNKKEWQYYVGITLTDKDCMEFISQNTNAKIIHLKKRSIKNKEMYRIHMHGKKLLNDLERLGVIPRKTFVLNEPILTRKERKLIPYILRGIIDGDGWVRKDGKEFFICTASLNFAKWVQKELINLKMNNIKIISKLNGENLIYYIRTGRQENIEILNKYVYNKPFGMSRKYLRLQRRSETIISRC